MRENRRFTRLDKKNTTYVIAVSGGPDSMFLLEKMRRLDYCFVVAHVNYNKRKESLNEKESIQKYCIKYSIDFFFKNVFYNNDCTIGKNFQLLAREIRYNFFVDICKKILISSNKKNVAIAVAHNLEDSIETYIMQKKRNSYVEFWGISFKSEWKKFKIFRPILNFEKFIIIEKLEKWKVCYSLDKTNEEEIYQRNIVRKFVFSLKRDEKKIFLLEIEKKNFKLLKKINEFKSKIRKIVFFEKLFLQKDWKDSELEIKERIVYYWLNNFSNNSFLFKKKKIFSEIIKQLSSKKKKIFLSFKNGFEVEKKDSFAVINRRNQ